LAALKRKFSAGTPEPSTGAQKPQKQPRLDAFFFRRVSATDSPAACGGGGDASGMLPQVASRRNGNDASHDAFVNTNEQETEKDSVSDTANGSAEGSPTGDIRAVSELAQSYPEKSLVDTLPVPVPEKINTGNKENSMPESGLAKDCNSDVPSCDRVLPISRGFSATQPVIIFDDIASLREQDGGCSVVRDMEEAVQLLDSGRARIVFDDFSPSICSEKSSNDQAGQDDEGTKGEENTSKTLEPSEESASVKSLAEDALLGNLKVILIEGDKPKKTVTKKSVNLAVSMTRLREAVEALKIINSTPVSSELLRFKAGISPEENTSAEAELDRQLSKSDFASMAIYGQFNLGFLIVGHRQDLFIVDQHATDEKYNFETLQRTTVIGSQRMVAAQRLELTSVGEAVVMDHLAVFQRNGFQFQVEPEAPPTQRVRLTHLPTRKGA